MTESLVAVAVAVAALLSELDFHTERGTKKTALEAFCSRKDVFASLLTDFSLVKHCGASQLDMTCA